MRKGSRFPLKCGRSADAEAIREMQAKPQQNRQTAEVPRSARERAVLAECCSAHLMRLIIISQKCSVLLKFTSTFGFAPTQLECKAFLFSSLSLAAFHISIFVFRLGLKRRCPN